MRRFLDQSTPVPSDLLGMDASLMTQPLLPPRGVHVPARMIYHPQLPPAVLLTWIQLRGLAWDGTVTPPLRMQELVALTGKCQASIYRHMSLLRSTSALSWRSAEQGTIIVSFAEKPSEHPASPGIGREFQSSKD